MYLFPPRFSIQLITSRNICQTGVLSVLGADVSEKHVWIWRLNSKITLFWYWYYARGKYTYPESNIYELCKTTALTCIMDFENSRPFWDGSIFRRLKIPFWRFKILIPTFLKKSLMTSIIYVCKPSFYYAQLLLWQMKNACRTYPFVFVLYIFILPLGEFCICGQRHLPRWDR